MGQRDKLYPVIYSIQNKQNKKRYIGSATRAKERWRGHKSLLKRNCRFSTHLQAAWNKYGEENFEWIILEEIPFDKLSEQELIKILLSREEYWIREYNTIDPKYGYNSRKECNTNLGIKWSEESKKAFSEKKKKTGLSKEIIEGVKAAWKTEEFRENHRKMLENWRKSLTEEDWKRMWAKRNETNQARYNDNLKKYGKKVKPETVEKIIKTSVETGKYTTVYIYLPTNGKYIDCFITIAEGLRRFNVSTKNTNSVKSRLDSDVFLGFIWSTKKYENYPEEQLRFIKENNRCRECIIFDTNNQYHYCKTMSELKNFNIPEYFVYKNLKNTDFAEYNSKLIYKIAPIIGDYNSKVGEIIENLYNKDNNEASQDLNGSESCND